MSDPSFVNREGAEIAGERLGFSFGTNWAKYLEGLSEEQIQEARQSLREWFGDLRDMTFLDIGCGSGLFSMSAVLEGARVTSTDVDPNSVACAQRLRSEVGSDTWEIRQESILDTRPATADAVYSWGVLHHTGAMWRAVEIALACVAPRGRALIALYNRPRAPRVKIALKRTYNRLPQFARPAMRGAYGLSWLALEAVKRRRNPIEYIRQYPQNTRGMTFWRDVEDWLGGLPFEYADPDIFERRATELGFEVERIHVAGQGACNEYLLRRV